MLYFYTLGVDVMGKLLSFFIGLIIVAGIIAYANPQFFPDIKDKISEKIEAIPTDNTAAENIKTYNIVSENTNKPKDLISECRQTFNECNDIYHTKYGISTSFSEIQEVNDMEEAFEFYDVWALGTAGLDASKYLRESQINEAGFPQVLIAYSIKSPLNPDFKLPFVAICNEDGELTESSKDILDCG